MRRHRRVLRPGFLSIVEVRKLWQRTDVDIIAQMAEQCGGNAPRAFPDALLSGELNVLISNAPGRLSVDNFVEAGENVAARDVLKHAPCLHQ